jgi:hypothetical protein
MNIEGALRSPLALAGCLALAGLQMGENNP